LRASLRDDEKVSFLTLNEKRAAVGYAPLEEPSPEPATEDEQSSVLRKYPAGGGRKYRPDQARAPAGTSDGGEWVDEGGGSGSGTGDRTSGRSSEGAVQIAQARRSVGPARTINVRGRNYTLHESLAGEVESALRRVDEAQKRARELDPDWKPLPSARSAEPTADVQTVLRGLRMEAQEAEGRITVIERGGVPLGFNSREDFSEFGRSVWRGLSEAGHRDAVPYMRGSSVTGHSFTTGEVFDVGRTSDYDIAVVSRDLFRRAKEMGVRLKDNASRTVEIRSRDGSAERLGVAKLLRELEVSIGRNVSIVIHPSIHVIEQRGPFVPID
jgi:hypothetical protein